MLTCDCQHRTKRGAGFSHKLHEGSERKDNSWVIPPLQQWKKQPGDVKRRWGSTMWQENISSLMNHVPQDGYNTLHVTLTSPSSQKPSETDISQPSSSKSFMLLSSFLSIKTCTDFALSQEVTKVTSNNYFLTSLLLGFLLHPKGLEQWHWFSSTKILWIRGLTQHIPFPPLGDYTVAGHGFQHFNQFLKFRKKKWFY